jgi:hypothetical protein
MAYTAYDATKPDQATQNGVAFGNSTKNNLLALRDAIVALGTVQGFNYYATGANPAEPSTVYFKRGTECVKAVLTWSSGSVTKAAHYYAANESHASFPSSTNGTYEAMVDASGYYVLNITYDGSGNPTSTTWNATP